MMHLLSACVETPRHHCANRYLTESVESLLIAASQIKTSASSLREMESYTQAGFAARNASRPKLNMWLGKDQTV